MARGRVLGSVVLITSHTTFTGNLHPVSGNSSQDGPNLRLVSMSNYYWVLPHACYWYAEPTDSPRCPIPWYPFDVYSLLRILFESYPFAQCIYFPCMEYFPLHFLHMLFLLVSFVSRCLAPYFFKSASLISFLSGYILSNFFFPVILFAWCSITDLPGWRLGSYMKIRGDDTFPWSVWRIDAFFVLLLFVSPFSFFFFSTLFVVFSPSFYRWTTTTIAMIMALPKYWLPCGPAVLE